uniref:Uncharacterized protein n=1 Tax=Microcebus murinus TaxID=30608 RepID=A0A8C6EH83_MICMU
IPGGGKKPSQLHKSKADRSGAGKGDLQSTLLEGHGSAPPDLDLSAINGESSVSPSCHYLGVPRKSSPTRSEEMEMMESQTLLLTLLAVKMEKGLARFEEEAEKHLLKLCKEKEELQRKTHELRRRLLLCQKKRELEEALDAQMEMLSPFEAVGERFQEQYRTLATALDATRHELPVRAIHLEGDGQQFLGALLAPGAQRVRPPLLLSPHRSFAQVLELSAEASKEAALINQGVWEEAQGLATPSQWYFSEDSTCEESQGATKSAALPGDSTPLAP